MDRTEREITTYGCSEASLKETVEIYMNRSFSSPVMVAISWINAAQEEIDRGSPDGAKKTLNKVKWLLKNYVMDDGE